MLKLWGRLSSINVRKVVLAAQLLELPFERIDAGASFGITKTPDYLALNPNALVPTLDASSSSARRRRSGMRSASRPRKRPPAPCWRCWMRISRGAPSWRGTA